MKALKKLLAILLALVLLLSIAPVAFAEEITEEVTYVLQRGGDGGVGPNMQYESPYSLDYLWDGGPGGRVFPSLYSMRNTTKNGEAFPTYCMDIKVEAEGGTSYRRLNLEDSTYSGSVAGRVRAIMLGGFYINPNDYASDAEHEAAVYAKVAALGEAAGTENLTLGEAISATQCAIWQAVHGSILSYSTFARSYVFKPSAGSVKYAELCGRELNALLDNKPQGNLSADEELAANTRIRTVYNYLLSLDPVAAETETVSPASFTALNNPVVTRNGDGTYTVSVTTTVNVDMAPGDTLTLKASFGTLSKTAALQNGSQTVELVFENVPADQANQDIKLAISGYQTASGVFLFDAIGGRNTSQTMVGMDNSRLPVYAEVVAHEDRILSITKTTASNVPLEGIIFDIHHVASLDDYLSGKVTLPDPGECTYPTLADYTVITDQYGQASLNFTQHGLEDGIYLVVERNHPAIVEPIAPFYVTMPMTNAEGTGFNYVVSVQPKNAVKGGLKIEKDVNSLDNNNASVNAYENHTWIISASIPEDIAIGKSYTISDTLDNRLDYIGNAEVTVETADGKTVAVTLTENTDYILTVNNENSTSGEKPSDSFTLQLTKMGMNNVSNAVGTNSFDDYRIRVRFDAQINANAEVSVEIPNQATVSYTNSVNVVFDAESDKPVVYTGAVNLLKVDSGDKSHVLSGAVFEVYRMATEAELAANVEGLTTLNGVVGSVLKVAFFDNAAMTGNKVTSVTSGADGKIAIYGLAYGTYYLVETQAPAGYNLMGDARAFVVGANSHVEENTIVIENVSGTVLPETGGIGTTVYTFTGIALVAISVLLFVRKRRAYGSAN